MMPELEELFLSSDNAGIKMCIKLMLTLKKCFKEIITTTMLYFPIFQELQKN